VSTSTSEDLEISKNLIVSNFEFLAKPSAILDAIDIDALLI